MDPIAFQNTFFFRAMTGSRRDPQYKGDLFRQGRDLLFVPVTPSSQQGYYDYVFSQARYAVLNNQRSLDVKHLNFGKPVLLSGNDKTTLVSMSRLSQSRRLYQTVCKAEAAQLAEKDSGSPSFLHVSSDFMVDDTSFGDVLLVKDKNLAWHEVSVPLRYSVLPMGKGQRAAAKKTGRIVSRLDVDLTVTRVVDVQNKEKMEARLLSDVSCDIRQRVFDYYLHANFLNQRVKPKDMGFAFSFKNAFNNDFGMGLTSVALSWKRAGCFVSGCQKDGFDSSLNHFVFVPLKIQVNKKKVRSWALMTSAARFVEADEFCNITKEAPFDNSSRLVPFLKHVFEKPKGAFKCSRKVSVLAP